MTVWVPELLSPAGSLEKLKVAVSYGANAVYCGGQRFGLRSAADNFTLFELEEGVRFAHQKNAHVYVVLNSFLHDAELKDLPAFLKTLERLKVDAVIVSDMGVVKTVLDNSNLVVHLSTQASCLNSASARLWKNRGVKRIVLGREVGIQDAARIKEKVDIELEMFVHGSMCMAYSGNCIISNYTQGRDSNRGGCAHSCRFEYSLKSQNNEDKKYAHFMSSKDLNGLRVLEEFINAGIDSLKVEGRMKSHHYAGTLSKVYSEALGFYRENGHFLSHLLQSWENELSKVGHRSYTQGSLISPAGPDSIFDERQEEKRDMTVGAVVIESRKNKYTLAQVRAPFKVGDMMELMPFHGQPKSLPISEIKDVCGETFSRSRPGLLWKLPYIEGAEPLNIIRIKAKEL